MKKYKIIVSILSITLVLLGVWIGTYKTPTVKADSIPTIAFKPLTHSSVLCATGTSTQLVATSTGREFIKISNLSSNSIFISLGVPAATSTGILMTASTTLNFDHSSIIFTGAIYCLAESGKGVATTTAVQFP